MAKKDVTIFKSETASKILAKLGKGGGGGGGGVTRGQPLSGRRPTAINPQSTQQHLIQIVEEHEDKEGYYIVEFVNRNITKTKPEDHEWYGSGQAESLIGLEMSGRAGLKADDKNKKAFMAFPTVSEDANGVTSIIWVFSVGGEPSTSVYDFVIKKSFDGEPDRYEGEAWTNYYGRNYPNPEGEPPEPDYEEAPMIIEDAVGDSLLSGDFTVKCVGHIEYHDAPIGRVPEPPNPLPDGYTPPDPPYATMVFRPINLWRYY